MYQKNRYAMTAESIGAELEIGVLKETLATVSSKLIQQNDTISHFKNRMDRIEGKFSSMFRDFEKFKDIFVKFF